MSDLAELLRDWRLDPCEHAADYADWPDCCSPCLRDRITAAGWVSPEAHAAAIAEANAEGRECALDDVLNALEKIVDLTVNRSADDRR